MVDVVLLCNELLQRFIVGQEQSVLSPGLHQTEKSRTLHQRYHVRILLAAVEHEIGNRLAREGVAVAFVNLLGAGED